MITPVLPSTVAQANKYLQSLDAGARSRGDSYFRERRVSDLSVDGNNIYASVRGSEVDPYHVILSFNPPSEWLSECSCPIGGNCKHVYAVMKTLLAEHSIASVQQLSSGAIGPAAEDSPKQTRKKRGAADFSKHVVSELGRPLKPEEERFLTSLGNVFRHCQSFSRITPDDFEKLGFRIGGARWEELRIWPEMPETLEEFWLYVAHAAEQRGARIPEFLAPVTNFKKIEGKFRRWQRAEEILRWKQALGNVMREETALGEMTTYELRIRLTEKAAILEWKYPGEENFVPMKKPDAREFRFRWKDGAVKLSPAAEAIWKVYRKDVEYGHAAEIAYAEETAGWELGQFFRLPGFSDLVVNPEGKPYEWSDTPLHWHMDPAKDEDDSYRIRVALPDGSPLIQLLCVLSGNPTLYVTRTTVYRGPSTRSDAIGANRDNLIPAPALETQAGAALLNSLGLELPPRLQDRVEVVPLQIVASCRLSDKEKHYDEVCYVNISAQTPDGKIVETYNGRSWEPVKAKSSAAEKKSGKLTVYNRRALMTSRRLYTGLPTQWNIRSEDLFVPVTKKFPEQLMSWLKSLPPGTKWDLQGELASFAEDSVAGRIRLEATEAQIDWFDLRIVLDVADTTLTKEELDLLVSAKGDYVRLKGKGWRRVKFNLDAEQDEQLARLGLSPHELTGETQRLHALQLADDSARRFLPEEQFVDIRRRADEIKARVTPEVPAAIKATLRPYQTEGFHFLAYLATNHFGGILADDMGLGKTLQTLTWLMWLRAESKGKYAAPSLVICPKSVMDNWRAEAAQFAPELRVKIWRGTDIYLLPKSFGDADLHVLNYSQLRNLGESISSFRWLALILDEGQYIKNPSSQTAQLARTLKAQHRLVLSGTPIENRLLDLWSLMTFAMPGVLGPRTKFAKVYDAKEDPFARRRLAARVRPFLLRRTKAQVAQDLPERIEEDLFCEMEGEQKALYGAELKRAQQMLLLIKTQSDLARERFHLLTSLLRLRQIACHPRLVKTDSSAESTKVEALLEQLEPLIEEGHKVLIFSQFVDMLDILQERLKPLNVPLFYLAGSTENRGELVQQFQTTEGPAVFLISLKAGGFGLNLTAASYVVLFDPWWNPAVENQAIDRTHRIGQTRHVIAYRLLIKDSIEEKIRLLQKTKSALADDVLGEEKFGQNLTLEDLHFLFGDDKAR